ncbi:tRNA 2-selenouridine(34) synthase MnmH [Herminiimonas sp. KBW02]|uniref:tRNA 2-selenouridine(34) synthase MnmH n=1 Tax=Herminiimonas sp. KBW02 TaxID=2153363 RepID=UPI000F591016|nr:tRNA 2-selenouridine(34) synthase MnmH [Herminiimonas sp. KBW02]RQO38561.1 tRNA 2-selenouridine(34) synthase MnmH [Herminiimonas sp. KBW02]
MKKYPALLRFADLLPGLEQFDTIIDVRSPAEFALDHIPGAINCPVLDDKERHRIGTLYKQTGAFEAKKLGSALVARNIAHHIETAFIDKPQGWKPLIYCWRGGNRSGAMTLILARIGWPAVQLDGGYKEYRRHVNADLTELPSHFQFHVICGPTGSGKSRLLQTLATAGEQVLDLEKLAAHRGSVLGHLPTEQQPSQKKFETDIWQTLRRFDRQKVIYIESESKKIGNLRVPDSLIENMRKSACISLELKHDKRIQLLMQDYQHFLNDPDLLSSQLSCLLQLHGREKIARWHKLAADGEMEVLVGELLEEHYDPAYGRSIERNFRRVKDARIVRLADLSMEAFRAAAGDVVGFVRI